MSRLTAPFSDDPPRTVVIVDFDGSLAPIVDDPAAAAPLPGALDVLARLAQRIGRVAVVSGRPVEFLRRALPVDGLTLVGQYGVERFEGGTIESDPRLGEWTPAVEAAATEAEAEAATTLPGLIVERKGAAAVALHWRRSPDLEAGALASGQRLAARHGLRLEPGRCTLELRAPLDIDKGTATAALATGAHAALVAGDDTGDLAAFAALARLMEAGRLTHGLRVAVRSPEAPIALLRAADYEVEGPAALLALLDTLGKPDARHDQSNPGRA